MKLPHENRDDRICEYMVIASVMMLVVVLTWNAATRYIERHHRHVTRLYITAPGAPAKIKEKPKVKNTTIARIIETLCIIESGGDSAAVGDGGRAIGILQIWPIMVREASRVSGIPFALADRWSPSKSRQMAWAVLIHYQKSHRIESPAKLAGLWNRPDGKAPKSYLRKFAAEWGKK